MLRSFFTKFTQATKPPLPAPPDQGEISSLAIFFGVNKVTFRPAHPQSFAHVIIDVQKIFCDPAYNGFGNIHTQNVSQKIAHIKPKFAASAAKTIIVYFGYDGDKPHSAEGGLHLITKEEGDILIEKNDNSAFKGSFIEPVLIHYKAHYLFISGFNSGFCVKKTVLDGLEKGWKIALLTDCIGQDNREHSTRVTKDIEYMVKAGAHPTTSATALALLHQIQPDI